MNNTKDTPEDFARDLYFDFSEFDDLNTEEVKKACCKVIKRLMNQLDDLSVKHPTQMRSFYTEARNHIKNR